MVGSALAADPIWSDVAYATSVGAAARADPTGGPNDQ